MTPGEVRRLLRHGVVRKTAKFRRCQAELNFTDELLLRIARHGRHARLGWDAEHGMHRHRFFFRDEDDTDWVLTCAVDPEEVGVLVLISLHPPREG